MDHLYKIVFLSVLLWGLPLQAQTPFPEMPPPDSTRELGSGVWYSHTYMPRQRWSIHVIKVDLTNRNVGIGLGKGLELMSGLEQVHRIAHRFDSLHPDLRVLAAVNANFWKSGTNHPMGPTVIDGEILANRQYKNWSSIAISGDKRVHIDNFRLKTSIITSSGLIPVKRFNYRTDSSSAVVYTKYFGDSVPYIDTVGIWEASRDTITDDSETALISKMDSIWSTSPESGTLKIQFEYLRPPIVNGILPCVITLVDTGFVRIPDDGGVISFGSGQFPALSSLFVGDTFSLESRLDPLLPGPVQFMCGGTPRILRDGEISVEWREEGLKKSRFVLGRYGRSSMGISADGDTLILLTVEPYNRHKRRRGTSLGNLARLLRHFGAYNGMNFDGGSSTTMLVEGKTVCPLSGNRGNRKITTTLMIYERQSRVTQGDIPSMRKLKRIN